MRKSQMFMAVAVITLSVTILGLTGCNRHQSPEERIARNLDYVGYFLDLTEQQRGKLDEVKHEILQARRAMRDERQAMLDEVITQVESGRINQASMLDLLDQHNALMRQAAPQVIAKVSELHATMTPEQKAEAVEHLTWFKEKWMR